MVEAMLPEGRREKGNKRKMIIVCYSRQIILDNILDKRRYS